MRKGLLFTFLGFLLTGIGFGSTPASRMPGIDSSSRFLVYYGDDFSQTQLERMKAFDVIVIDPNTPGVNPSVVAYLQSSGVRYVLAYISIGEDDRELIVGNGEGPISHDGSRIVESNRGIASFYVDQEWNGSRYVTDGLADMNKTFGGRFIYPNDDWRWVINTQRIGGSTGLPKRSVAGLQQIAKTRKSDADTSRLHDFGFDGFFLDTIDTAGPYQNVWGYYPWAAEEMKNTAQFIHDSYPDKIVMANRGVFYYNPAISNSTFDIRPYDFTLRPYVHAVVFESYLLDSDPSHKISPYFGDNKHNFATKIMAEANRPDGFTVFCIDYQVGRGDALYNRAIEETVVINGWVEFLAEDMSLSAVSHYAIDHAPARDITAPVWDSTGTPGFSSADVSDRIGIQAVRAGNNPGEVVIQWDTAKDQTLPIKYHIYQSTDPNFSDAVQYKAVDYLVGDGWAQDPTSAFANQYTISGLDNGTYYFRVRAEDSTPQRFTDTNEVTRSITLKDPQPPVSNPGATITLDGNLSDWGTSTPFVEDPQDVTGSGQLIDWRQLRLAHNERAIFMAYENNGPLGHGDLGGGQCVYLDVDSNRATGFRGGSDEFPVGAEYLLQGRFLHRYIGSGTDWSWKQVGAARFAVRDEVAEISFSLDWIEDPTAMNLFLVGTSDTSGDVSTDQYPDREAEQRGESSSLRYEFTPTSKPARTMSVGRDPHAAGLASVRDTARPWELHDWRGTGLVQDASNYILFKEFIKAIERSR